MPTIGGSGARHLGQFANELYGQANRYGHQGQEYKMAAINDVVASRERLLARLAEMREYRLRSKIASAQEDAQQDRTAMGWVQTGLNVASFGMGSMGVSNPFFGAPGGQGGFMNYQGVPPNYVEAPMTDGQMGPF